MPNNFLLELDTTAPAGVSLTLAGGATATGTQTVTAAIATSDGVTTGYQMKLWGTVDGAFDVDVQATEATSNWISYSASKSIKLATGDGVKTLNLKIRDDVWNESAQVSDTITLDTSAPVPNVITGPSPAKISKVAGKRVSTFGWQTDQDFVDYKVKVVTSATDPDTAGTTIGTTNGSTNVAATGGTFLAATTITTTIDGADLEAASAGDGQKRIKVFVKDATGNWSL